MASFNQIRSYSEDNGGRVAILFLLFFLAMYQFYNSGIAGLTLVAVAPLLVVFTYLAFKHQMLTFWILTVLNYVAFFLYRTIHVPVPMSILMESIELVLIVIAIICVKDYHFERCFNLMFLAIIVWCSFCTLEILNDTCNIGIDVGIWFKGARMMAYQLMYIFVVFTLYISDSKKLLNYLRIFAFLSILAAFWAWKQKTFGFTAGEREWLNSGNNFKLHMINGVMRYFSLHNDAANFGTCMGATSIALFIFAFTSKIKRDRWMFFIAAFASTWAMFSSGTRTAIFCFLIGIVTYVFLSKSIKIAVPVSIFFVLFVCFLAFTKIGNGNAQIRRMRSAFDRNDASMAVRDINKETMRKYMKDAPWGIGLGQDRNVPANNKYNIMATIPPDSELVYIWLRTGIIGITTFLICVAFIFIGGCWIVLFRLRNSSLRGIGAGLVCAFASIMVGSYANKILMQFPNCMLFFGGMAIVYLLPYIENEYQELEEKRFEEQKERERLKLEKKKASRV